MTLTAIFSNFRALLEKGQTLEAIDQYFADGYQQFENGAPIPAGKHLMLQKEKDNLDNVTSLSIEFKDCVVDETKQQVWGEMDIYFRMVAGGLKHLREAFFQQWVDGKITVQRFYYQTIETVEE